MIAIEAVKRGFAAIGRALRRFYHQAFRFPGSGSYWDQRYAAGGNSGSGSYGKFALFKAEILNAFVAEHGVSSVIEYGCGDGNQVGLAAYPHYLGFDVSPAAVARCAQRFAGDATKAFRRMDEYAGETAELGLSLDVIYHLVEDEVFEAYMQRLFASSTRFVAIYASNQDTPRGAKTKHIRHRHFTPWVEAHLPQWRLLRHIPNRYPFAGDHHQGSFADFYIYCRD